MNPFKTPAVINLSERIIAALEADSKSGGYDLEAGMFGPEFSDLVVELAGTPDEELRTQFEAWLTYASDFKHATNPKANEKTAKGAYFYAHVELAWSAWKHAKKAPGHKALEILNKEFLINAVELLKSDSLETSERFNLIQKLRAAIPYTNGTTNDKTEVFYLVSFSHKASGFTQFWLPDNAGYTPYIEQAGLYSREAIDANPDFYNNEVTVPVTVSALHSIFAHHKTAAIDTGLTKNMLWRSSGSLRTLLGEAAFTSKQPLVERERA